MKSALAALGLLWPALAAADHELDDRDISSGQALYMQHCASCHGADLEGQPDWRRPGKDGLLPAPPHDASGHTWHHDNRMLFDYTKLAGKGLMEARGVAGFRSGMPGLGHVMSDDEIWDALAYIRSTWPERIRKIQATRNPEHGRRPVPFRRDGVRDAAHAAEVPVIDDLRHHELDPGMAMVARTALARTHNCSRA